MNKDIYMGQDRSTKNKVLKEAKLRAKCDSIIRVLHTIKPRHLFLMTMV